MYDVLVIFITTKLAIRKQMKENDYALPDDVVDLATTNVLAAGKRSSSEKQRSASKQSSNSSVPTTPDEKQVVGGDGVRPRATATANSSPIMAVSAGKSPAVSHGGSGGGGGGIGLPPPNRGSSLGGGGPAGGVAMSGGSGGGSSGVRGDRVRGGKSRVTSDKVRVVLIDSEVSDDDAICGEW
jgi:hypothetical protein